MRARSTQAKIKHAELHLLEEALQIGSLADERRAADKPRVRATVRA